MPVEKDCVSVKQADGKRVKVQNWSILCNLKEAYVYLKTLYSHIKLGFTKFFYCVPKSTFWLMAMVQFINSFIQISNY